MSEGFYFSFLAEGSNVSLRYRGLRKCCSPVRRAREDSIAMLRMESPGECVLSPTTLIVLGRTGAKVSSADRYTHCGPETQSTSPKKASCQWPLNERIHTSVKAGRQSRDFNFLIRTNPSRRTAFDTSKA